MPTILRIDGLRSRSIPTTTRHLMYMSSAPKVKLCSCSTALAARQNCAKATGSTDPKYAKWRPIYWLIFQPFAPLGRRSVEIPDAAIQQAEQRMRERMESNPHAIAARYDRRVSRVMVSLSSGLELAFPPHLAEGLADAKPADLAVIEITPTGLGLDWSKLDADLYLPALLEGVFGSPRWMAGLLGKSGGLARTAAKVAAARGNGRKGGRPRKRTTA